MKRALLLLAFVMIGCQGKDGAPGAPGASGKIVASIYCEGQISAGGGAASLDGLNIEYNAVLTAAGDVYATASVADEYAQYSGTQFYAAGENGSSTGAIYITADFHSGGDGGWWKISLNRNTLVTSVSYTDPSLGVAITTQFPASHCTIQNW